MKRFIASLIAGLMILVPSSALAEEDLEARIEALEERVAALEALIGTVPEQEEMDPGLAGIGINEDEGYLTFKRFEIVPTYDDGEAVMLYFDFFNNSGETASAIDAFSVQVFQHGREQNYAIVDSNDAYSDRGVEFRSGADPVEVAFALEIQDRSDIIVSLTPYYPFGGTTEEFTLSLE